MALTDFLKNTITKIKEIVSPNKEIINLNPPDVNQVQNVRNQFINPNPEQTQSIRNQFINPNQNKTSNPYYQAITVKTPQPEQQNQSIVIKPGDTLSGLSSRLNIPLKDLIKLNPQIENPDLIRVGEKINIPPLTDKGILFLKERELNNEVDLNKTTISDLENKINKSIDDYTNQQLNLIPQTPIPKPEVIAENEEQLNKINKKPIEEYESIMLEYDIPNRIKELETMRSRILAATQVYDDLLKEVRDEAGVPENIRQKRMALIENARDINLKALQYQYDFLKENYDIALQQAKIKLGLKEEEYKTEEAKMERIRDNTRQMIQQMINTGALGDLTDEELRNLASNSGYSFNQLKTLRKAVKTGNERKIEKALLDMEAKAQQMDIARERLELAEKSKEEKVLSPTDIKNLKELYGVSLPYGITEKQAQEQIKQLTSPRDFTDEELRTIAKNMKSAGLDFNEALQEFRSDKIIQNKDKAELITREVYGKTTENKNLINSFFARLFGK